MEEVRRRSDGELCGHVERRGGSWCALVVFGAELGRHATREQAVAQVLAEGLDALSDRWILTGIDEPDEQVVCIQEANAAVVTVALGYYSMPGVPTRSITSSDIAAGVWTLRR